MGDKRYEATFCDHNCGYLYFVLSGCIGAGEPTPMIEQYVIEYPQPVYDNLSRVDESIKIARFSMSRHLNCCSMLYKPAPFKREAYNLPPLES